MITATAPFWGPALGFVVFNVVAQPLLRRRARQHYADQH